MLAVGELLADVASANVVTVSYYRMGEKDPGVVVTGVWRHGS